MSRQAMIILHSILSLLIMLVAPLCSGMYLFGLASLFNAKSRGAYQEIIVTTFSITIWLYPLFLNIYGWIAIILFKDFHLKMLLYPFIAWVIVFLLHVLL